MDLNRNYDEHWSEVYSCSSLVCVVAWMVYRVAALVIHVARLTMVLGQSQSQKLRTQQIISGRSMELYVILS